MKLTTIIFAASVAAVVCGCATKTRNVELDGMFTQADAGMLAIGSVDVMGTPVGEESAIIKYSEDNAWLQPSMKLHSIRILLTGTNSTANVTSVVESICGAFIEKSCEVKSGIGRSNPQVEKL